MSSITSKSSFFLPSHSTPSTSFFLPASIRFPRKLNHKGRFSVFRAQPFDSSENSDQKNNKSSSPNAGDPKIPNGTMHKSRKDILLEYVQNVQPEFMELFVKRAPHQVLILISSILFFSEIARVLISIYKINFGWNPSKRTFCAKMQRFGDQLPYFLKDPQDYAPGTQKKVTGDVIRWNNISGPEKIDAVKYIELLEAEIDELNRQVARKTANGHNELLEYLKSLEPQNLKELTSSAGEDVVLAMNTFIKRLLAVSDPSQMKTSVTETSAPELAKLLYWLMMVGYSIRNIEVRFDMERVLGATAKLAELPPGENI
ncbi:uncharacterized protein LOC111393882 [Olea europaea subsp. europaea]|uniref:Uncharacterized protein LOC111393882 n=1 Tax=Olea europaea subsp. europaea TaxID=158383 RepID=A0A8S0T0J7_OLEEU|nr:uncharacterized protein LOC111393882 [Olea europaea subsp. europaea]